MQKYYQNEPRLNGVYSRDNLPNKIKYGAYVISLDEYSDVKTHWIGLYVNAQTITCFHSFRVEHIPKEIKNFLERSTGKYKIVTNIFRMQAYDSVMFGYFCIGFIGFILKGKLY